MRKVLDATDVQGDRDMSGFEFEVTAGDGESIGRLISGADGRTPTIETTGGSYTIAEIARPTWADGLIDGGPITFEFEPTEATNTPPESDVREVTYTNVVPSASITSAASDASDGDQVVDLVLGDATIVDTVSYTALVPGTEYTVTGELMVRPTDADADAESQPESNQQTGAGAAVVIPAMIGTGTIASITFVPTEPDGNVDVVFSVPGDSPLLGHVVVVYQHVAIAASGRIVAAHADPDATEQKIRFAEPVPTVPTTTAETVPIPETTTTTPTTPTTTTTTTPPATTVPAITTPPTTGRSLPRTGGDGSRPMAAAGLVVLLLGLGLLVATVRDPARRRPSGWPRSDV